MIEPEHLQPSIRRQCELVGLNRSTFRYMPVPESDLNLHLMRLIDKQCTGTPFYGWPRMTVYLRRQGYEVNHKRVQHLMRKMGMQAIYPKPRTSIAAQEHKVYPYLLRNRAITRPNQVWSTDITYIPMLRGFMYLVAIMDWCSRYVVSWQLSNTLNGRFCLEALDRALVQGQPEIFNTDQGAQFTALAFTSRLEAAGIRVSVDGRGRALDNVFVERLWRSVKYEHVYLYEYAAVPELEEGLHECFTFYNHERPTRAYRTRLLQRCISWTLAVVAVQYRQKADRSVVGVAPFSSVGYHSFAQ